MPSFDNKSKLDIELRVKVEKYLEDNSKEFKHLSEAMRDFIEKCLKYNKINKGGTNSYGYGKLFLSNMYIHVSSYVGRLITYIVSVVKCYLTSKIKKTDTQNRKK
jgi:hypothetical protein